MAKFQLSPVWPPAALLRNRQDQHVEAPSEADAAPAGEGAAIGESATASAAENASAETSPLTAAAVEVQDSNGQLMESNYRGRLLRVIAAPPSNLQVLCEHWET